MGDGGEEETIKASGMEDTREGWSERETKMTCEKEKERKKKRKKKGEKREREREGHPSFIFLFFRSVDIQMNQYTPLDPPVSPQN